MEDHHLENTLIFQTSDARQTEDLGERIGRALGPGLVVALFGELGAGKTTFTKGLARGLGSSDLVHSPTFNLIHEHRGRTPIYHFDLYRLKSSVELEDLGYEEYFYGEGVSIIEWPEKCLGLLPADHIEIRISGQDDSRTFDLRATGPCSMQILRSIKE